MAEQLVKLPEKIEFVQCPKCDLVKRRNRWVVADFEKMIAENARMKDNVRLEFISHEQGYEVVAHGWEGDVQKKETHSIKLKAIRNVCPVCGRLLGGYYEAKLQLRGDFTGENIAWLEKEAERLGRNDRMAFYRTELLKEGVDFFFGSKKAAQRIAQGLRKNFGAELTASFQVAGRKEGKELRRTIISVRFP